MESHRVIVFSFSRKLGRLRENFITCETKSTFLAIPVNQMTSKSSLKSLNVVPKQGHQIVVYGWAVKPIESLTRRL